MNRCQWLNVYQGRLVNTVNTRVHSMHPESVYPYCYPPFDQVKGSERSTVLASVKRTTTIYNPGLTVCFARCFVRKQMPDYSCQIVKASLRASLFYMIFIIRYLEAGKLLKGSQIKLWALFSISSVQILALSRPRYRSQESVAPSSHTNYILNGRSAI